MECIPWVFVCPLSKAWALWGYMSPISKSTCRSKRNWRWEASSTCPRRFWGRCWQAGSEKLSVTFSMLISIVCLQLSDFLVLSSVDIMFALTVDCECWWCKHWTIQEDCQYLVHHRFPFGHEILKGWNLILNRIRVCHLCRRLRTYLKMRNLRKVH